MSDIEKRKRVYPGYQPLANVLQAALDQAQAGKGNQRHANGKPFLEQSIITDGRACGLAGPAFQARKKILEALNCPDEDRAVQDLLGAIVYTAAMVILKEEERQKREEVPEMNAALKEPKMEVYGGHVVCSGCGLKCSIGSEQEQSVNLTGWCTICHADKEQKTCTVPPPQDGDDDPIVRVVPDRTSRDIAPTGVMIEQSEADLNRDLARAGAMLDFARRQRLPEEKIIEEIKKQHRDEIAKIEREHLVNVVSDRTARSGEVDASDWRPCPND